MNRMMRLVVTDGTGSRAAFPDFDIAGKTGTSQDYRDAWFVGYTSELIAGVWVGNDDNSPTKKVTGGLLPAEIWHNVMEPAHRGLTPRPLPGEPLVVASCSSPPPSPKSSMTRARRKRRRGRNLRRRSAASSRGSSAPSRASIAATRRRSGEEADGLERMMQRRSAAATSPRGAHPGHGRAASSWRAPRRGNGSAPAARSAGCGRDACRWATSCAAT